MVGVSRDKNVFICNECVGVSVDMLRANGVDPVRKADEGHLVYSDDFFTPSRFLEGRLANGCSNVLRKNGFYHIALYSGGSLGFYYDWQTCNIPLEDFRVSVEAGFAPDFIKSTTKNACYGVIFRCNKDANQVGHYRFSITRNSLFRLDYFVYTSDRFILDIGFTRNKVIGPNWSGITDWIHSNVIKGDDGLNALMVCMRGKKIIVGVNGEELLSVYHYEKGLEKGSVGLCVSRPFKDTEDTFPEARFRRFRLYSME
jgi:hypothetical protein